MVFTEMHISMTIVLDCSLRHTMESRIHNSDDYLDVLNICKGNESSSVL